MKESFSAMIEVSQTPDIVFTRLKDVLKWWGGPDLAGRSGEVGDEFTVTHGDAHYSKQRVTEVVQDSRIVWHVIESNLNWLQRDKAEWTGTRMIFSVTAAGNLTELRFTHDGLTGDKESYARCAEGWTMVIKSWLSDFITLNKPHF